MAKPTNPTPARRTRPDDAALPGVARALESAQRAVAEALAEPLATWDKFASDAESMGRDAFVTWETIPLVHYLARSLGADGTNWRSLYLGERLKQLHWPGDSLEELIARRERVFQHDRVALLKIVTGKVSTAEMEAFSTLLDEWRALVTVKARNSREVRMLLVGDCIFLDITTFLAVLLLERGMTLRPTFATGRNPVEMKKNLRALGKERFDVVCFSPYTYEQSIALAQTHAMRGIRSGPAALRAIADEAHAQMLPTLKTLCEVFECSIYVQNASNIRRHDGTASSFAKNFVTAIGRKMAARRVNELLEGAMRGLNADRAQPVVLVDEIALLTKYGDVGLGRKFYSADSVHPTVLSLRLAEIYADITAAAATLTGKKVIVADLDHTLWAGVIGEGDVVHHLARQKTLKRLRAKGILLTIASKNDPKNIRWDGALLGSADFVAQQIHWEPKSTSVRRIASELNLSAKDFVFIDDRADEREMVAAAHPGTLCLDATDEATWRMLDWWASSLGEQKTGDRTMMYAERKLRQAHMDEAVDDPAAVLAGLGLKVTIRALSEKDLDRAVELVNRTNQFNVRGSRVTRQQMAAWRRNPDYRILLAEASDKFGAMGIISVMVVEAGQIAVWVLSCRVFGYGIETALLNEARRTSPMLRGSIVETANNQPCREVYASNGFHKTGDEWVSDGGSAPPDPAWLSVTLSK